MKTQKYSVNQHLVETILSAVRAGEIAIPEIQRPFVWDSSKVRDLMDSLYQGFPVGYLIAWRNPDARMKDGGTALGKKILIDGQQRVTALRAALLGDQVLTKDYRSVRMVIAFHPVEERFEVSNVAIQRDPAWLQDISSLSSGATTLLKAHREYIASNPGCDPDKIERSLTNLTDISKRQIGLIELEHDLDIEIVTEIFIRINSQGVVLSQADFAMSKIASAEEHDGPALRKTIDYFCRLSVSPEFFSVLEANDSAFMKSDAGLSLRWLRNENDDLYDPSYIDVLRVAFTTEFERGKLSDLVSLLSGRNFQTKTFEEAIAKDSFARLRNGVSRFSNENDFKRFLMIVRSAGFIRADMMRSQNAINFAYVVYLKLRSQSVASNEIERIVRRWLVMSILTGRASGSFESQFEADVKALSTGDASNVLANIEAGALSDAFWDVVLLDQLKSSTTNSPAFWIYVASQVRANDKGFLSRDLLVRDLVTHRGDIHHFFPKEHLKQQGAKKSEYNQLANLVYMQTEINIQIGKQSPATYLEKMKKQCMSGKRVLGNIESQQELQANFAMHALPIKILDESMSYEDFLRERQMLMARKIRDYYKSL